MLRAHEGVAPWFTSVCGRQQHIMGLQCSSTQSCQRRAGLAAAHAQPLAYGDPFGPWGVSVCASWVLQTVAVPALKPGAVANGAAHPQAHTVGDAVGCGGGGSLGLPLHCVRRVAPAGERAAQHPYTTHSWWSALHIAAGRQPRVTLAGYCCRGARPGAACAQAALTDGVPCGVLLGGGGGVRVWRWLHATANPHTPVLGSQCCRAFQHCSGPCAGGWAYRC